MDPLLSLRHGTWASWALIFIPWGASISGDSAGKAPWVAQAGIYFQDSDPPWLKGRIYVTANHSGSWWVMVYATLGDVIMLCHFHVSGVWRYAEACQNICSVLPGRLIPEEFTKEVPKPTLVGEETSEDRSFVLRSWWNCAEHWPFPSPSDKDLQWMMIPY